MDNDICPECGRDLTALGGYRDFLHYRADERPGGLTPCLPTTDTEMLGFPSAPPWVFDYVAALARVDAGGADPTSSTLQCRIVGTWAYGTVAPNGAEGLPE